MGEWCDWTRIAQAWCDQRWSDLKASKVGVDGDAVGDAEDRAVVVGGFAGGLDDDFLELTVVKIGQQGVLRDAAPQSEGRDRPVGGLRPGWRRSAEGRRCLRGRRCRPRRAAQAAGGWDRRCRQAAIWARPGVQQIGGAPVAAGQIALEEGRRDELGVQVVGRDHQVARQERHLLDERLQLAPPAGRRSPRRDLGNRRTASAHRSSRATPERSARRAAAAAPAPRSRLRHLRCVVVRV